MQLEAVGMGLPASFHRSQGGVASMPSGSGMGTRTHPARSLLVLSAPLEAHGFDLPVSGLSPDVAGRTLPDEYLEVIASQATSADDDAIVEICSGTYPIAARHARGGWDDLASTQPSYQFCIANPSLRSGRVTVVLGRAAAETLLAAYLATRAGDLISCPLASAVHG